MKKINQMEPWIGEEEKHAMNEYLDSGGWLTEFKRTKEFERMMAEYVGSKYASAVNNGTISLTIVALALGIGQGDEVIVPDYTMIASANSIVLSGGEPVLIDIDPENICIDLDLLEETITDRTKAVMFVSINGRYTDMEKLISIVKRHNLYLIEDAAQSLGSRCKGKHLGTFGEIGSFSFSSPKIITTGQGGVLVTDDERLYERISLIKDFGRSKSGRSTGGADLHEILGFNFKFTDLQAVIGIEQMKKLDWRVKRKKEMFKLYHDLLEDVSEVSFIDTNLDDTAPWFIDILVQEKRDELAAFLDQQGIGTRPFYPPIHTQPPYAHVKGDFKDSEYVSLAGMWLPSSSFLTDQDLETICAEIRRFFKDNR